MLADLESKSQASRTEQDNQVDLKKSNSAARTIDVGEPDMPQNFHIRGETIACRS